MGREIRRVPPTWEHPKAMRDNVRGERMDYVPLYDHSFTDALEEWLHDFAAWVAGGMEERLADSYAADAATAARWRAEPARACAEWEGELPRTETCRPHWAPETATAYQVYETVSEGTPASPVLQTREALRAWLMEDHTDWPGIIGWENPGTGRDDFTRHGTWKAMPAAMADRFMGAASIPTFVTQRAGGKVEVMTALDDRAQP